MMNFMIVDTVNPALRYDATAASHPIHNEAYDAAQIGTNMDTIGYDKGGSIVRLMVSFLGEDTFYKGIRLYLNTHQDSVAEQDDLFKALEEVANADGVRLPLDVTQIMHTWTLQKGFPLVHVSLDQSETTLSIFQEPWENAEFRLNESLPRPDTSWDIPVKFILGGGSTQEETLWLLEKGEGPDNVTVQIGNEWVLLNPDAGGFYRTQYDDKLATRLLQQLEKNHSALPVPARIRLIDDQFTLGFESKLSQNITIKKFKLHD